MTRYWFVGYYLSLRSIQHQIIELAEDALLQLVPGDAPVLMHEKWRSKPREREEVKEVRRCIQRDSSQYLVCCEIDE